MSPVRTKVIVLACVSVLVALALESVLNPITLRHQQIHARR